MLDYDDAIRLDAEDLAEGGIAAAYDELRSHLVQHVPTLSPIEEIDDPDAPSYSVRCAGTMYVIYSPDAPGSAEESWGRAAYALFDIVNRQLSASAVRFYAINGGNDLLGMLLTPAEALDARASLPHRGDWPYIPERSGPWFGQPH